MNIYVLFTSRDMIEFFLLLNMMVMLLKLVLLKLTNVIIYEYGTVRRAHDLHYIRVNCELYTGFVLTY